MSLKQPHLKMSKSHPDIRSRILITDSPDEIRAKIKVALTDSETGVTYDSVNRPGVANLLQLMSHFDEEGRTCQQLAQDYEFLSLSSFKGHVAECIISGLNGIKKVYDQIISLDEGRYIDDVANQGSKKARHNAEETMDLVRRAVGLDSGVVR